MLTVQNYARHTRVCQGCEWLLEPRAGPFCATVLHAAFSLFRILQGNGLKEFEVTQIANLAPAVSEEAKQLIPSLIRINDDDLQRLLDDLATLRKYE